MEDLTCIILALMEMTCHGRSREDHVETLGQGDALIVIDAEDERIIYKRNGSGQAGGQLHGPRRAWCEHSIWCEQLRDWRLLRGSCLGPKPAVHRGDSRGAVYLREPNGTAKDGTVIIPGGSPAGTPIQAALDAEFPDAVRIQGFVYAP